MDETIRNDMIREETAPYADRASRTAVETPPDAAGRARTCVPARQGQDGYREPAEPGPEAHIVRGED